MALAGLASSLRRRLTHFDRRPGSPPAYAPDRLDEEVHAFLDARIRERHDTPDKYMANEINHMRRYVASLRWIPDGAGRVLDPAAGDRLFTDLLAHFRRYELEMPAFFDLEREAAPYADDSFDGAILMEVLEHFKVDPMFALSELNRILKPGGFLLLTTPNLASWVSLHNLINHETPYIYGLFERQPNPDRHNREYTVHEVGKLAKAAGFRVERLEAITVYPAHDVVPPIRGIPSANRGDTTFLLARKAGPVRDRHPSWLYAHWE
jgi:SAM-dependent methyltransferase